MKGRRNGMNPRPRGPQPIVVQLEVDVVRPDGSLLKHGQMGFAVDCDCTIKVRTRTVARRDSLHGLRPIYTTVEDKAEEFDFQIPHELDPVRFCYSCKQPTNQLGCCGARTGKKDRDDD